MISLMRRAFEKVVRTLKAFEDFTKKGGSTYVNVVQVKYGEVLKNKTVLVTGGGSGIGFAIAEKCLAEGAKVVITGRNKEKLEAASAKLNNPRLLTMVWDVSEFSNLEVRAKEVMASLGGQLDILINNAGLTTNKQFLEVGEETWDKIISTNAKGLFFVSQAISQLWIKKKQGGKILNIASMRGFLGVVDGPYGMSKWGVVGLTRGLGATLLPYGILVNGIAPGAIAGAEMNKILGRSVDCNENLAFPLAPIQRFGLPEEIAELAIFLVSDAANYIVGQTIICDGGYTLKI